MSTFKVLMAEDEEGILEIMARKVSGAGYDVITALDGEEAWQKIQDENPDLILLDITMPKMDGWEVLRHVREQHNPKWQPVIIISALNETHNMQKGFDMKADHYLTKPCRIDEIIKSIRMMISLIPMRND